MRRLALIAVLAACDGDDGGSLSIDEIDDALRNEICGLYVECGLIDDLQTCRAIYTDLEVDEDLIAAVKAGKVIYHSDKASQCLAGLYTSCERNALTENNNPEACDATFEGTVAAGGQCAIDEECISQECDVPGCSEACCYGTCIGSAPTPRPRAGEACSIDGPDCIDSVCDFQASQCTPYRMIGQPCSNSGQCSDGACVNQICTALPGPGEPCGTSTGGVCDHLGYICSTTSMTCVSYGLTGDPCTTARDCSPIYQCNTTGTCELRPTLGEACDSQTGGCIDESYCDATTMQCTAPKADGAMCMDSEECRGYCDLTTGMCATDPVCI